MAVVGQLQRSYEMYKQVKNITGEVSQEFIQRVSDSAWIPLDTANTDYQAYLEWLEAGNTPLPAEENKQ